MNRIRYQPSLDYAQKSFASEKIDTILRAAEPANAFKKHFDASRFNRPTHILAFGKASIEMTNAAVECLGDRFARASVISSPELCAQSQFKNKFIDLLPATHPYPTTQNIQSTDQLVEHARSIPIEHQALVLVSGGGSAMLCSPKDGVTLDDLVSTSKRSMSSGSSIYELNALRSKQETLKAGGLAKLLCHAYQTDAYVLSDVIGNDIQTIASGPLVDQIPPSIKHTIIASNQTILDALCAWIAIEHIYPVDVMKQATGPASTLGQQMALKLIESTSKNPCAVCLGGEPTVDVGDSRCKGGPMLELALSCSLELSKTEFRWTVLTFASDGIDGPTDACGAVISNSMVQQSETQDAIRSSLESHDSLQMCDELGATIRTGATGTNVNDVALVIRWED
ncbi:MAG: DUF4147 domain-containing protein [Phycisphaerales bacterium]|nr:DUF4147 domain-containing protein [Phycisphaerales bacterium]